MYTQLSYDSDHGGPCKIYRVNDFGGTIFILRDPLLIRFRDALSINRGSIHMKTRSVWFVP